MKKIKNSFILILLFFVGFQGAGASEEYQYYDIQEELLHYESELRTQVKKGASYIRQLESVLGALQNDEQQLEKIFTRMQMLREPERFDKMSANAQILINYIYYSIIFLELEPPVIETQTPESNSQGAVLLSSFPNAQDSWAEGLDVKISQMGYSMVYFNTESGVKSHPVTLKSMTLTGSSLSQDIALPQDAGVYMAGYITIETAGGYDFTLTYTPGQVELILAGKTILSSGQDDSVSVSLDPGQYILELQYINDSEELEIEVLIGE